MGLPNGTPEPIEALQRVFETCGSADVIPCCKVDVWWMTTKHGRRVPFNAATGENHFLTCPDAAKYSGKGKKSNARNGLRGPHAVADPFEFPDQGEEDGIPPDWVPYVGVGKQGAGTTDNPGDVSTASLGGAQVAGEKGDPTLTSPVPDLLEGA